MKPTVHVILPEIPKGSYEAGVVARSLESFRRQMHPFDVVLHESDLDYENAKNPHFGNEVPVYSEGKPAIGSEKSVSEKSVSPHFTD